MNQIFLSVVIPAYNEEKRLPKTLESIAEFLNKQNYTSEVLVVSGGSTDKTVEVAKSFFDGFDKLTAGKFRTASNGKIKNLKVIEIGQNRGKGYVVRQGIMQAQGEIRLFMDADNSTSINQVQNFLPFFSQGYDVVIGDRDLKGSRIKVHQPRYKELLGDFGNFLIQALAVPGIADTQCGFKAFSEKAAKDIFPRLTIDKWGFDIEILTIANLLGYKIKTVPVVWVNDPESKVKLSGYINTLKELFQIKWNLVTNKYKTSN